MTWCSDIEYLYRVLMTAVQPVYISQSLSRALE